MTRRSLRQSACGVRRIGGRCACSSSSILASASSWCSAIPTGRSASSTTPYADYSRRLGIEVLNERELSLFLYLAHELEFPLARENVHQPSHQRRRGRRTEDFHQQVKLELKLLFEFVRRQRAPESRMATKASR